MIFEKTIIEGAMIIHQEPFKDNRGYFSRIFCKNEFQQNGINFSFVQANLCHNKKKKTLRGLHYQQNESAEDKLVVCSQGAIYDVCVDVREGSLTYGRYIGVELSEDNGTMLFLPKGCAHGYLTLQDDCQLIYFMSEFYKPGSTLGFMHDDPIFSIKWPLKEPYLISEQDSKWNYIK